MVLTRSQLREVIYVPLDMVIFDKKQGKAVFSASGTLRGFLNSSVTEIKRCVRNFFEGWGNPRYESALPKGMKMEHLSLLFNNDTELTNEKLMNEVVLKEGDRLVALYEI